MKCIANKKERVSISNLYHMTAKIAGEKKRGNPRKVRHCLVPEPDSSDKETVAPMSLTW